MQAVKKYYLSISVCNFVLPSTPYDEKRRKENNFLPFRLDPSRLIYRTCCQWSRRFTNCRTASPRLPPRLPRLPPLPPHSFFFLSQDCYKTLLKHQEKRFVSAGLLGERSPALNHFMFPITDSGDVFDEKVLKLVGRLPERALKWLLYVCREEKKMSHSHTDCKRHRTVCFHNKCERTCWPMESSHSDDDLEEEAEEQYWKAAGGHSYETRVRSLSFCSRECAGSCSTELRRLYPSSTTLRQYDSAFGRSGKSSPSLALSRALSRNMWYAKLVKKNRNASFLSLASSEVDNSEKHLIKMMNVDVGLLYVSTLVNDISGKTVAPSYANWRRKRISYLKPLCKVLAIYNRVARKDETLLTSVFVVKAWLSALKDASLAIVC